MGTERPAVDAQLLARFCFSAPRSRPEDGQWALGLPLLAGSEQESWWANSPIERWPSDSFFVSQAQEVLWLSSETVVPDDEQLASLSESLFREAHSLAQELGFSEAWRSWAIIPQIHRGDGDQERYKQFCLGRHEAYAAQGLMSDAYPAATVIGSRDDCLRLHLVFGRKPGQGVENPRQTSAYHYPREYGPRSPSFSRAMQIPGQLLISGTAAVQGSASQHIENGGEQLRDIMVNLQTLMNSAGAGDAWPQRLNYGRLYLRPDQNPHDLHPLLQQQLSSAAPWPLLAADICRPELLCEIETSLT